MDNSLPNMMIQSTTNDQLPITNYHGASGTISTTVERSLQISPFLTNKANFQKSQTNVNTFITMNYEQRTMNYEIKNKPNSNPIQSQFKANSKPIQTQNKPNSNPISRAKNSCARLWPLLQCFSENFDKPGERKAECSARPKLRTNPMNLLGTMPAKEGKIHLKHSFCRSAFCFMVDGYRNYKFQKLTRKGNKNDRD